MPPGGLIRERNLQDYAFLPIDDRPEKAHSLYYPLVIS
jgi:hypothetical protein